MVLRGLYKSKDVRELNFIGACVNGGSLGGAKQEEVGRNDLNTLYSSMKFPQTICLKRNKDN